MELETAEKVFAMGEGPDAGVRGGAAELGSEKSLEAARRVACLVSRRTVTKGLQVALSRFTNPPTKAPRLSGIAAFFGPSFHSRDQEAPNAK